MKGDSCPYDHGTDALILDDVTITTAADQSEGAKANDGSGALPGPRPLLQSLPLGMPFPPPVVCHSTKLNCCCY